MVETITVYMPHAESGAPKHTLAPRLDTIAGKTIGLINNAWRSVDITYKVFHQILCEKYEVAEVIEKRKPSASTPMPQDAFDELATRADAVIVSLGT